MIVIPGKKSKNNKNSSPQVSLEDFIEIKSNYLMHLHNSYIKYTDKITNIVYSGGFITSVDSEFVHIRLPGNKESVVHPVPLNTSIFYVKNTNLNYQSIQKLIMERNKLEHEKKQLQNKIIEFEKTRNIEKNN